MIEPSNSSQYIPIIVKPWNKVKNWQKINHHNNIHNKLYYHEKSTTE